MNIWQEPHREHTSNPKTMLEELNYEKETLETKIKADEERIKEITNLIYWNKKRLSTTNRQIEALKPKEDAQP